MTEKKFYHRTVEESIDHAQKYIQKTFTTFEKVTLVILAFLSIGLYYITVPIIFGFLLFKIKKVSKKVCVIAGIGLFIILILINIITSHIGREPVLTITSPEKEDIAVQADTYTIRGSVVPKNSHVIVNSNDVEVKKEGDFEYEVKIGENSSFVVQAENKRSNTSIQKSLKITRLYSEEEKAEMARVEAEIEAKKQAELDAYYNTKAGKVCKAHPEWSKSDCEKIADNKYWIGMHIDMLKYNRGLPNNANPSNYGGGVTQWQWCWHNYTPSCFYDQNGDMYIDAYN